MAVDMLEDSVALREPEDREADRRIGSFTGRSFAQPVLSVATGLSLTGFLLLLAVAHPASAQLAGQSFAVTPDTAAATVGDSITLRFRIRLHERDQPLDSMPQVVGTLPPGVRVLSVERLSRSATRVYEGSARVAFYRPGRRPAPIFGLPFMRVVEGVSRATLASDSAFVDITPVLPAGDPPLRDIKELERRPRSLWRWLILALTLVLAGGFYRMARRRRGTVVIEPESRPEPVAPSPYQLALERLERLEAERWPAHGNVALHYETTARVLREYLEQAHAVGALERTTSELLWTLPPHLSRGGLRDRCHDVFGEADLVKFAEVRPSESRAADFLRRARHLLAAWHGAPVGEESVNALR